MDAAQKSLELQTQVRQNAEVIKNTLNDLYNWEKEIKDMEKKIQSQPEDNREKEITSMPVRSHIKELDNQQVPNKNVPKPAISLAQGTNTHETLLSPSSEKQDTPNDPLELKHKEANEVKDRGNKFVKLGEYARAIEVYTQALQLYDNDAVYYSNRALCFLKLERYEECIEDCDRAIEIDRLAVKAYYRRMMANESLGNNMDSLKDCTTVLMIDPKNGEAKRSLERINARLRKNVQNPKEPNFTPLRSNLVDILPIEKPAYKRSTKPLCRVPIADVVSLKDSKNYENLTISDDDIDKLFNSYSGNFEEIKQPVNKEKQINTPATKELPKPSKEELPTTSKAELSNPSILPEKEAQKQTILTRKNDGLSNKIERPLPPAPTSTVQFYANWKELTPKQKYIYLKSIPLKSLCKILGASFGSETLTDIINTLHDFYLLEKDPNTGRTLAAISKAENISILSLLLSNEERNILSEILESLKATNSIDAASAEQITKTFNLN